MCLCPSALRGAPVLQATVPLCRGAFLTPHRGEAERGANPTATVQSWCPALTSAWQVCCGTGAEYSELQLPVDGVETLAVPSLQSWAAPLLTAEPAAGCNLLCPMSLQMQALSLRKVEGKSRPLLSPVSPASGPLPCLCPLPCASRCVG